MQNIDKKMDLSLGLCFQRRPITWPKEHRYHGHLPPTLPPLLKCFSPNNQLDWRLSAQCWCYTAGEMFVLTQPSGNYCVLSHGTASESHLNRYMCDIVWRGRRHLNPLWLPGCQDGKQQHDLKQFVELPSNHWTSSKSSCLCETTGVVVSSYCFMSHSPSKCYSIGLSK